MVESTEFCNYLDNVFNEYEKTISAEYRLIGEIAYPLNKSCNVSVGLSAARGFVTVIKIANNVRKKNISFTADDWDEFLKHIETMTTHYNTKQKCCYKCGEQIHSSVQIGEKCILQFVNIKERKVVKIISSDVEVNLDKNSFNKLKECLIVLEFRYRRLTALDFPSYYNSLLLTVLSSSDDVEIIEQIRNTLVASNVSEFSENTDLLLEILLYETDKIKQDVGSLRVYNELQQNI
jgi:hypothetical protein